MARDAQQTDSIQSVKAMLLDRGATANCKPELEIFADDVKCAHGASVGELDKEQLFYAAARGLDLRAPLAPAPATAAVVALLRSAGIAGPGPDRHLSPEIETAVELVRSGAVLTAVHDVIGDLA